MTRLHVKQTNWTRATILIASCLVLQTSSIQCQEGAQERKTSGSSEGSENTSSNSNSVAARERAIALAGQLQRVKDVCRYDRQVQIGSIHEMLQLIRLINSDERICKPRFMSAIYELDAILKLNRRGLCDEEAFEMIKDYHFRFIQPPKRANRRPTQFEPMPRDLVKEQLHPEPRKYTVEFDQHDQVLLAPVSIRHFFLKFALQVSFQCKKNLINNLEADSERLLTAQDLELMHMFERDSPIGQALAGSIERLDFDSVLYMPQLDGKLTRSSGETVEATGEREQHLRTSARKDSALFLLVHACKSRLKPLYDRLILPVVRMSKLGYDYQGQLGFSQAEQQFLAGATMKTWLIVVHVCEIFKKTRLIRVAPKRPQIGADSSAQQEPRAQSESGGGLEADPEDEGKLSPVEPAEEEAADGREAQSGEEPEAEAEAELAQPIEYEPGTRFEMGDELMIANERQLDWELSLKYGRNPFGFAGFLRRALSQLKRALAKLDLERFAHYRHHSLFYSGLLNFLSGCSNVASITMTISSLVASGRR